VLDVGTVTISSAGNQSFKFTATGKNAASSGFTMSFDTITLSPQLGASLDSADHGAQPAAAGRRVIAYDRSASHTITQSTCLVSRVTAQVPYQDFTSPVSA
jgi:hypothetical protein